MKAIRKPLKKSILQGFGIFAATLSVTLLVVQFFFLRNTLYAGRDLKDVWGPIMENLLDLLIIVVILGFLFATAFMIWADRHIVQPVRTLEKDVTRLAQKSRTSRNPDALLYSAEGIKTGNEVESLARAVENLSVDMRDYVKNLVEKEREEKKREKISA